MYAGHNGSATLMFNGISKKVQSSIKNVSRIDARDELECNAESLSQRRGILRSPHLLLVLYKWSQEGNIIFLGLHSS